MVWFALKVAMALKGGSSPLPHHLHLCLWTISPWHAPDSWQKHRASPLLLGHSDVWISPGWHGHVVDMRDQLESWLPTTLLAAAGWYQTALAETWLTQPCYWKSCPTFLTPRRTYSSPSAAPLLHLWFCLSSPCSAGISLVLNSTQQASRRHRPERQSKAEYLSCFPFSLHA